MTKEFEGLIDDFSRKVRDQSRYDSLDSVILAQDTDGIFSALSVELTRYRERLQQTLDYAKMSGDQFAQTIEYIKQKKDNVDRVLLVIANRNSDARQSI